jgi:hypothetical protein
MHRPGEPFPWKRYLLQVRHDTYGAYSVPRHEAERIRDANERLIEERVAAQEARVQRELAETGFKELNQTAARRSF